jgi:hypothetical protein
MVPILTRNVMMICLLIALSMALVGCSGSDDDMSADLQNQLDTANDQLAMLQAQVEELMARADISPQDLAMLQAQVEELMARADISPQDLAMLQAQVMGMQSQLDEAEKAAIKERIGNVASWYDVSIARNADFDLGGETAWHSQSYDPNSGSNYATMMQSYKDGGWVYNGAAWHGEDGQIEFHVGISRMSHPLQDHPVQVWPNRFIYTADRNVQEDSVKTSTSAIEDHSLQSWQGFEASKTYDGGGTLSVRFFTDLEPSDDVNVPFLKGDDFTQRYQQRSIILNDPPVPTIPADQDGLYVIVPDSGLEGSLGGTPGRFSCAPDTGCALGNSRQVDTHYPFSGYMPFEGAVIFTPDDGNQPEELAPFSYDDEVLVANYLSFGSWLYVPADVTDANAFEFGVFAGGDDPFVLDNLMGLTGSADYAGEASGMYAETLPSGGTVGTFNAKVELTADFGTASDYGNIGGKVYEFQLDSGNTPPLTELMLLTQSWRDDTGTSNLFRSYVDSNSEDGLGPHAPGGWIESNTWAMGTDGREWSGVWGGKFLGNGATPEEHPSSFAGTFGVRDQATNSFSLAGSFGTHKQ